MQSFWEHAENVLFDEDRVTRRSTEASFGKMPTTLVRRLISAFTRSSGFVDQIFGPVRDREGGEGEEVLVGVDEHVGDVGELELERGGDLVELVGDVVPVGLGEDRADRRGDHLGLGLAAPWPARCA